MADRVDVDSTGRTPVTVAIGVRQLSALMTACVVGLVVVHSATQILFVFGGYNYQLGLQRLFNLGAEANIPTWYSSASLMLCAGCFFLIGRNAKAASDRFARHWSGLAGIFVFLSVDEGAMLHELTIPILQPVFEPFGYFGGYLFLPWVILWGAFACGVGIAYLRFLAALPADFRVQLVVAGLLFVSGAAGTELFEARIDTLYGYESSWRIPIVTLQETMEMAGILVLFRALMSYLRSHVGSLTVSFGD